MARPRGWWWILALAACALCYLALAGYSEVFGPGAFGLALRFRQGNVQVVEVVPGYPAARAGIETGDQVVAAAGQPIRTLFDWRAVADNIAVGRPLVLDTERGRQRREASLSFDAHWRRWGAGTWLTFLAKITAQLVTLALALLIGVRRPRDLVALLGAFWLAAIAVTDLAPIAAADPHVPSLPAGASVIWRSLPVWMTLPLWVGATLFLLGPAVTIVFFTAFPRPAFRSRRGWWLLGLAWAVPTSVVGVPLLMLQQYRSVYDPTHATGVLPGWFTPYIGATVLVALGIALMMLAVNYRRLVDRNERRRLRVVVVGTFVGLAGSGVVAMASFFDLPPALQNVVRSALVRTFSSILFLALPLSFAYAILRHRLLDVGLIVRQGLQYAFARRMVVSLVPACALLLLVDLVVHGDQPLRTVLQSRGWIYAAVAVLALAAHARQRSWLAALDRRFFRERYDAQRLLREVVEEIRGAADVNGIAPQVVTRIEAALHPEYAALLVRPPRDTAYRTLAVAPRGTSDLTLRADSKLVALARLLQKPLEAALGESGWLVEQLPPEETTFLREARIGLIVPVATPAGAPEAMLVLGVKRSEEPYAREDRELLMAVAAGLALVAERPVLARPASAFEECPRCGACYDAGTVSCESDGARLQTVHLPRVLNDRYRLARRLGRGGMGTVYEAADTSLERRVAVKVIRDDLVGSADAAQRFRLEARAAASFSHPNVVTVHDFGIAAERRAFLVMELLRGASVRQALREERRFAPARALAVVREVSAAMDAAHQRGLVHRDLKPENVFLAADGNGERVKVLDFGLAKFLVSDAQTAALTEPGIVVGTLHYMAPEQLRGCTATPSWDLWAIAVMAYEMLSGALPFPTASSVVYQNAVLAGRMTSIADHMPEATSRLEAFFARALAADPARRPARAPIFTAELADALE